MKKTGMVRKVDELGRIVIPKEIRDKLGIEEKDPLEIYVQGERIVLEKYVDTCCFCGNAKDLIAFKDKLICQKCTKDIMKMVN